ncbi:MAG: GH32 C-terminal domain-containing protein, partial [Pseudomonadota bacterium]
RIIIGWMSNWDYALKLPTAPWRGALTAPRELRLIRNRNGIRLAADPVRELDQLKGERLAHEQNIELRDSRRISSDRPLPNLIDLEMHINWENGGSEDWALEFRNADGESLTFDFQVSLNQLTVDRSGASVGIESTPDFMREISAPLDLGGLQAMGIRILKDSSSIELFLDDGRSLLTLNYFTDQPLDQLEISPRGSEHPLTIASLDIFELSGTWE